MSKISAFDMKDICHWLAQFSVTVTQELMQQLRMDSEYEGYVGRKIKGNQEKNHITVVNCEILTEITISGIYF